MHIGKRDPALWFQECVKAGIVVQDHIIMHGFEHTGTYVNFGALLSRRGALLDQFLWALAEAINDPHSMPTAIVGVGNGVDFANLLVQHLNALLSFENSPAPQFLFAKATRASLTGILEFRRHQDAVVKGNRVIIIDDVYQTGATLQELINLVLRTGGLITRCVVLLNRSAEAEVQLTLAKGLESRFISLEAVFHYPIPSFADSRTCPQCIAGEPYNLQIGKGAEYHHLYGHPQSKTAV